MSLKKEEIIQRVTERCEDLNNHNPGHTLRSTQVKALCDIVAEEVERLEDRMDKKFEEIKTHFNHYVPNGSGT